MEVRTFDDRTYLELRLQKAMQTDENGNFVVWAEASNEELDYDGQVVLQRALLGSRDYFLKNGVISYDHRHLASNGEPDWNPEKYIIGQPVDVVAKGPKTLVQLKLFKSNALATEVANKIRDGAATVKCSVGGKKPHIVREYDPKYKKEIEKVTGVQWDELAITYKPVNQTLAPVAMSPQQFVKSLSAGHVTDSAAMTGGQSLIPQSLEGSKVRAGIIKGFIMALAAGELESIEDARRLLKNRGCSDAEAEQIIQGVVEQKKMIKGVFGMDRELRKSFDESVDELRKALKKGATKKPIVEDDFDEDEMDGYPMPSDDEDESLEKSIREEVGEEFLDVTPYLGDFAKSIDSVRNIQTELYRLVKAIGQQTLRNAEAIDSMISQPGVRKSVLSRHERFGAANETPSMSRQEVLRKSVSAVDAGKLRPRDVSIIEDQLNKGMPLSDSYASILKSL